MTVLAEDLETGDYEGVEDADWLGRLVLFAEGVALL